MRQMSAFNGCWLAVHQADAGEIHNFGAQLDLQSPSEEGVGGDEAGFQYTATHLLTLHLHFLSKSQEVFGGFADPLTNNEGANSLNRLQEAASGQVRQSMANRVSPHSEEGAKSTFGWDELVWPPLSTLDSV